MKTLLKNGYVVNVFTQTAIKCNVLIEGEYITGVGEYGDTDADCVFDVSGKYICPAFIDGHIHIESTMMCPYEFSKAALLHGTAAVVTDPHEIANVCGTRGIDFMLKASNGLPLDVYVMLPSCVPSTCFDNSYKNLTAKRLKPYLKNERVLGLAEMMNYEGVLHGDKAVAKKLALAKKHGCNIDGHAPMLSGKNLDKYISAGIFTDHECSNVQEATEKLSKGQWIMIRQGTAARNLKSLMPLLEGVYSERCLLATDDKEPSDLLKQGHIDSIVRTAVSLGAQPVTVIKAATYNAAHCFGLKNTGAIAPGYKADINIINNLTDIKTEQLFKNGKHIVKDGVLQQFEPPKIPRSLLRTVKNSVKVKPVQKSDFIINTSAGMHNTRIIEVVPGELITNELHEQLDFSGENNGIDIERDILKIAVIERHHATGLIGLGFIKGIGLKSGAVASTVSHDSHNIIVIGTSESEMLAAVNRIIKTGGGNAVIKQGKPVAELALEYGGLMSGLDAQTLAEKCLNVRTAVYNMGVPQGIAPFMNMAFVSLPVIPSLKLTCKGLIDVNSFKKVPLFLED